MYSVVRMLSRGTIRIQYSTLLMILVVIIVSFILVLQRNHPTRNISQTKAKSIKSSICIGDDRKNCLAPFKKFDSKYRISRKYKLLTCVIEKNMSTILAAIICFLFDEEAFQQANRSITTDLYEERFCKNKNEYFTAQQIVSNTKINLGDWTMFTVARDPIDRFLSGYVNKCILETKRNRYPNKCYGCGKNLSCFVDKQFERAQKYVSGKIKQWSYEDIHFYPQNWHCEFHTNIHRYHIVQYATETSERYEKMLQELANILRTSGVNRSTVEKIAEEIRESRTVHATFNSPQRAHYEMILKKNPMILKKLVQMFYYDYILFGFPIPNI